MSWSPCPTRCGCPWPPSLTPANVADHEHASSLQATLPEPASAVLGDQHDNDPALAPLVAGAGRLLVITQRGRSPHHDGVAVRRLFQPFRSHAVENSHGHFKAIFVLLGAVPTRGLAATRRFALGGVLLYHLTLRQHAIAARDLRQNLTPFRFL
jgi:hypothetical protein